jgi:hypothetical protein
MRFDPDPDPDPDPDTELDHLDTASIGDGFGTATWTSPPRL